MSTNATGPRFVVKVAAGKVKVHDPVRNKTKVLTAGQSYVAARRSPR
jgi:ferric-dicitrate binding protein FerR (iron transport regulator)